MPQKLKLRIVFLAPLLLFFLALQTSAVRTTTLNIGFVTDWEFAKGSKGHKASKYAIPYLEVAIDFFNEQKPDLVIGGGDYIRGDKLSTAQAEEQLRQMRDVFFKLDTDQLFFVVGNHDLRSLTTEQYQAALGIDYLHRIIDLNGFRLILLDTNFKETGEHYSNESYAGAYVSESELAWLDAAIKASKDPVIIFSHHSPMNDGARNDVRNTEQVKEVIARSGRVVAVISGHNPTQFDQEENGVHYIVVNNLVDRQARRTHAFIQAERKGNKINLVVNQYGEQLRTYAFSKELK